MRRPLRNIEIFSMSVLDMFASALGAFIMIAVILFPFFNQVKQLDETNKAINITTARLGSVQQDILSKEERSRRQDGEIRQAAMATSALAQCREATATCKEALAKTFLVIAIEWGERCDVDLYVTDPDGHQFSYKGSERSYPNSQGQLSLDMMDGPGIEVWQNPDARAGDYKVVYDLFSGRCPSALVRGWVIDRSGGKRSLRDKLMRSSDRMVEVAIIRVNGDGSTTIEPWPR